MDLRFDNQVVLVTGASSGIGRALALAFGASGARTAVHCHRHRQAADEIAGAICQAGGTARVYQADVTDRTQVEQMAAQVTTDLGPIDVLVNNAGSAIRLTTLLDITDEFWDQVMAVNLRSAFLCCRAVVPQMMERQSGAIINVSSVVARNGGGAGELAYTTAKGALSAFTRGLTRELSRYGIRANTVAPGPTDTPFHEGIRTHQQLESIIPRIPLGRLGLPEDIVGAVLLLASDAGTYLTGQSIEVNGGFWVI
jgi:3-oxoacyl-[acyl-carrier protein] reductase